MGEKVSPFTPGSPVPVDLFVGREPQIQDIINSLEQTVSGKQKNIFLVGERGVGKTSIASFARNWAEQKKDVIGIQVFLGGVNDLKELVRMIYEDILKVTKNEEWFTKIRNLFGNFINEVGLFGISVGFSPPKDNLDQLVRNFPESLNSILINITEHKKGLFIVLDDLDELSSSQDFANWYKSFVDKVATHYPKFPVILMLIGLPHIIDELSRLQPSLMRIFKVINLKKLSNENVKNFFVKAYEKAGITVEDEALNIMVRYSGGLPVIMHEIGDAIFWVNSDGIIDVEDALNGMIITAKNIGEKYLEPKVYRTVRSKKYRSILRKMASREHPLTLCFARGEVTKFLTEGEKKAFSNFLRRMREIGIIKYSRELGRGNYCFVNNIYPVYMYLEAKTHFEKK
jgi:hypothetical protein